MNVLVASMVSGQRLVSFLLSLFVRSCLDLEVEQEGKMVTDRGG